MTTRNPTDDAAPRPSAISPRANAAGPGAPLLFVAFAGVLGGAERVLLDWARALERRAVLACPPGPLAEAATGFEVVPLRDRPLRRGGRTVAATRDLAALRRDIVRLVHEHRPAVVVASGQRPLLAAAWAPRRGAKLLALQHDLTATAVLRVAAARADAIVATSGAIAQAIDPAGRRLARTSVIHPGVEPAAWALPDPLPGPPRALFLGALVPWKRADLALEIAARVPELALDVAGAPLPGDPADHVADLRERAARPDLAGRVRFLGRLDDPRTALAEAHLLLHTADREPFGLALVEALAAGRPVVAPAAAGPLEIVTTACGRLYRPGDPHAGAAAVEAVLADPAAPAAARARAAVFDGPAAARRFAAIVDGLAQGQTP